MDYCILNYELNGLTLKGCIQHLINNSDAYIESVLYARFSYKYSIREIAETIAEMRIKS